MQRFTLHTRFQAGRHMQPIRPGKEPQRHQPANRRQGLLTRGRVRCLAPDLDVKKADIHHRITHTGFLQQSECLVGQARQILVTKQPCMHPGGHGQQDQHDE